MHLEMQVMCPMFLHYLMHQVCKGPLMDEELTASLVPAYLVESHHPQPVPPGPLKFFVGGLPTDSGPHAAHFPNVGAGLASATIWANCLVGDDSSNLLAVSNTLSCSACLANSSCNGGCLFKGAPPG